MSAHKRRAKGKSHDDQEKVVLVTTMALFANISDSWWIGSSHHIFFRKEEFEGADMIEELGSSYIYGQWHFDCNQRPRECVIAVGKRKVRRDIKC